MSHFKHLTSLLLLFTLSLYFFIQGIFLSKRTLTTKSLVEEGGGGGRQERTLIMLLVDALREDFVEMGRVTG